MSNEKAAGIRFKKGMECLLKVTDRHFLVRILEIGDDIFRVSFPGQDYPVEGLGATLEFHDADGFYYLPMEIVQGPSEKTPGIALRKCGEMQRNRHRSSCRVPTDLTVQVKEQIHIRRYNAALLNISAGGALIQTDAPFDFSSVVELSLSLPGEPAYTILAEVVHMVEGMDNRNVPTHVYGLKFIELKPEVARAVTAYACQRMRQLYAVARDAQIAP